MFYDDTIQHVGTNIGEDKCGFQHIPCACVVYT